MNRCRYQSGDSERRTCGCGSTRSGGWTRLRRTVVKLSLVCLAVFAVTVLLGSAAADEPELMFPVPEFSDHPIPTASVPNVDGEVATFWDVLILLAALGLATYFTLVSRSRRHVLMLTIASLLWFGFW